MQGQASSAAAQKTVSSSAAEAKQADVGCVGRDDIWVACVIYVTTSAQYPKPL